MKHGTPGTREELFFSNEHWLINSKIHWLHLDFKKKTKFNFQNKTQPPYILAFDWLAGVNLSPVLVMQTTYQWWDGENFTHTGRVLL